MPTPQPSPAPSPLPTPAPSPEPSPLPTLTPTSLPTDLPTMDDTVSIIVGFNVELTDLTELHLEDFPPGISSLLSGIEPYMFFDFQTLGAFQQGNKGTAIVRGIIRAGLPELGYATADELDVFVTETLTAASGDGSLNAAMQAECSARTSSGGDDDAHCDMKLTYPTAFQKFEYPTLHPTPLPTLLPTLTPSAAPTPVPTSEPTPLPTPVPTLAPTPQPSPVPSPRPSPLPTSSPTPVPTPEPSTLPTPLPSSAPTSQPTPVPPLPRLCCHYRT